VARDLQKIIDADYEVVGSYRIGEEHRTEKGWYFTGKYDHAGHPYFRKHRLWFEARAFLWLALMIAAVFAFSFVYVEARFWIEGSLPKHERKRVNTPEGDKALALLVDRGVRLSSQQEARAREIGLINADGSRPAPASPPAP
jgi:hypothetical protein